MLLTFPEQFVAIKVAYIFKASFNEFSGFV